MKSSNTTMHNEAKEERFIVAGKTARPISGDLETKFWQKFGFRGGQYEIPQLSQRMEKLL